MAVKRCDGHELELIVLFDRHEPALEAAVGAAHFMLFCTPAINLFPKRADRIHLSDRDNEYHVIPDRTRPLDFEILRADVGGRPWRRRQRARSRSCRSTRPA